SLPPPRAPPPRSPTLRPDVSGPQESAAPPQTAPRLPLPRTRQASSLWQPRGQPGNDQGLNQLAVEHADPNEQQHEHRTGDQHRSVTLATREALGGFAKQQRLKNLDRVPDTGEAPDDQRSRQPPLS